MGILKARERRHDNDWYIIPVICDQLNIGVLLFVSQSL